MPFLSFMCLFCSSSPGSIEEHTITLVLMGSIAYARLKNVTNTLRIARVERRLEGTLRTGPLGGSSHRSLALARGTSLFQRALLANTENSALISTNEFCGPHLYKGGFTAASCNIVLQEHIRQSSRFQWFTKNQEEPIVHWRI